LISTCYTGPKKSAAATRRGGQRMKIPETISFFPLNFLKTFFSRRKLKITTNKYPTKMVSAARRQIIGGGGAKTFFGGEARPEHGSI